MRMPIFSGKWGYLGLFSLAKISREIPEKGVFFVTTDGKQYPR